jgi:hypothetical protein
MATDAERRDTLEAAIHRALERGARLDSRMEFSAILVVAGTPNHVLHLVLSIVTFGIWLLAWLLVVLRGARSVESWSASTRTRSSGPSRSAFSRPWIRSRWPVSPS